MSTSTAPAPSAAAAARHYIVLARTSYGHTRPLLNLVLNLIRLHPHLHITFLTSSVHTSTRIPAEIARHTLSSDEAARLMVVGLGGGATEEAAKFNSTRMGDIEASVLKEFGTAYERLVLGQPAQDGLHSFGIKPTIYAADIMNLAMSMYFKRAVETKLALDDNDKLKEFAFIPAPGSATNFLFGVIQPWDELDAIIASKGVTEKGALEEWCFGANPSPVMDQPGFSAYYRHEILPQPLLTCVPDRILSAMKATAKPIKELDGFIYAWTAELEPDATDAMRAILKKGADIYPVGPQLPRSFWDGHGDASEYGGDDVRAFMDRALATHGEKAVMLISFGTSFFPTDTSHLLALIETLNVAAPAFPYVFSWSSGNLDKKVVDAVAASNGLGMIAEWVPQQAVFAHPALGRCLSHCGSNTANECMVSGTPIIAWPLNDDQPFIASALSQPPFSAAFELIQIRTGPNVGRPVYRGGFVEGTDAAIREEMRDVFARARGPEGEEKRRNMAALRELVNKSSFGENGSARDAMARLGTVE